MSPRTKREVQRIIGRVAALNRFISRSTDKCLPFYVTLKGNKKFEWTEECEKAFQQLKHYLATPPLLAKPVEGGTTFPVQRSISHGCEWHPHPRRTRRAKAYFLRKQDLARCRHTLSDDGKTGARGLNVSTKVEAYFQSHTIVVLTSFPLRTFVHSPSQSGRLAKWAIVLSEYDIEYREKACAKSQVLAKFLV